MRDDPAASFPDAVSAAGLVSTHGKDHAGVGTAYLPQTILYEDNAKSGVAQKVEPRCCEF